MSSKNFRRGDDVICVLNDFFRETGTIQKLEKQHAIVEIHVDNKLYRVEYEFITHFDQPTELFNTCPVREAKLVPLGRRVTIKS